MKDEVEKVKPAKSRNNQHDPSIGMLQNANRVVSGKKILTQPKKHQSPQSLFPQIQKIQRMVKRNKDLP